MSRQQYLKSKGWVKIFSKRHGEYRYTHVNHWSYYHNDLGHPSLDFAYSLQMHWEKEKVQNVDEIHILERKLEFLKSKLPRHKA